MQEQIDADQSKQEITSDETPQRRVFTRREVLGLAGVAGAVVITGCGGGGGGSSSGSSTSGTTSTTTGTTTTGTTTSTGTTTTSTEVTPEGEEGPYFTDDSATGYDRSAILSNLDGTDTQTGVPLTLTLHVYDSEKNNAAVSGVQIDIWHCSAEGVYSNEASESTSGQSWLRGYQITDSNGMAQFTTIVPGWYQGRTTHIHLRVRSSYDEGDASSDNNTTQVFFPQSTIDYLAASVAPYSTEGTNPTTNASDRVYAQQTLGENLLTLSGSYTSGFTASFNIYLPITVE